MLDDLFRMYIFPLAHVSYFGMLGREIGLCTKRRETIHEQRLEDDDSPPHPSLKRLISQAKTLVSINLPFYMRQDIEKLELKIQRLQYDFKFLSFGRLCDFFYLDIHELKLCFERVSRHRIGVYGVCLSKDQIIDGIKLRAQEEFSDDPNYEEIQTWKLDEIFLNQREDLTYETNEILREIDRLEEIKI
jgi:hypothetical protein